MYAYFLSLCTLSFTHALSVGAYLSPLHTLSFSHISCSRSLVLILSWGAYPLHPYTPKFISLQIIQTRSFFEGVSSRVKVVLHWYAPEEEISFFTVFSLSRIFLVHALSLGAYLRQYAEIVTFSVTGKSNQKEFRPSLHCKHAQTGIL